MLPVYHDDHIAFSLKQRVALGSVLQASNIVKPDGTSPVVNEILWCYTCHRIFDWQTAVKHAQSVIVLPKITYSIGDRRPDIFEKFGDQDVRPIFGPENDKGERPLIGVILADEVERFTDIVACADANECTPST